MATAGESRPTAAAAGRSRKRAARISSRLTTEPVTRVLPKGRVVACRATNRAVNRAVRVMRVTALSIKSTSKGLWVCLLYTSRWV